MTATHARRPRTVCFLAAAGAAVVLLVSASSAMADSATLTVTDSAGRPDPAAQVPRVLTIAGTAAVSEYLYASYRPAGGAPCAPTPNSDNGSSFFNGETVNGAFSKNRALTINNAGTYQFCIWLTPSGGTVTTPITQVFIFRSPTGTISATLNPLVPRPGQQTQVTVSGSSEAPEYVYATARPAGGAPCAPTFQSDTGSSVISGESVNGAFTKQGTITEEQPGNYTLCLWLASSSSDAAPIAGPQAIPFTVVQPPPRVKSASVLNCASGRHVGSVRARFVSAVCMRYAFSVLPLAGQKLTVSFITPARRTYKRVSVPWPQQTTPTISIGSLLSRGYKHRRGVWQAVLRVGGKEINRTAFRVR